MEDEREIQDRCVCCGTTGHLPLIKHKPILCTRCSVYHKDVTKTLNYFKRELERLREKIKGEKKKKNEKTNSIVL